MVETSSEWTGTEQAAGMVVSHDGRGRALGNGMVERLCRTVKYEDIYLRDYGNLSEARTGLDDYFRFYNRERLHQALDYRTPLEVLEETPRMNREGTGNGAEPGPLSIQNRGGKDSQNISLKTASIGRTDGEHLKRE